MHGGTEWLVEAAGCCADKLRDLDVLRRLCEQLIEQLDLHVVGAGLWHQFPPPSGVTGLYLLTESHLACHTYPETGLATFNLYSCRPRPDWAWRERLCETLGAKRVTLRVLTRGLTLPVSASAAETTVAEEGTPS